MTERVLERGKGFYFTFLNNWGEVPCSLVQSRLGCWISSFCCYSVLACQLTASRPETSPAQRKVLLEMKRESEGPGSPSSPPLLLVYFAYVTYSCGNLEPHEAGRSNGNLELVFLESFCLGGLGYCGEERM